MFSVVRRLAYGGMAEILLVRRPRSGSELWVVKRILPHLREQPGCLRMFQTEGSIGLRLSHPRIVRTHAVVTDAAGPGLILEYIRGHDVAHLLGLLASGGGRMSLAEVATLGGDVADALAYAHLAEGGGVVHRDVTPSNVMVTPEGGAKIIDFGVALDTSSDGSLASGCIKGKVAYMSPQQALGEPLDSSTDQYSLALLLWECLAGEPCYPQGGHFQMLSRVARGEARELSSLRADLPVEFVRALARALRFHPAERFSSMAAFGAALARFRDGEAGRRALARRMSAGQLPSCMPLSSVRQTRHFSAVRCSKGLAPAQGRYTECAPPAGRMKYSRVCSAPRL